jgi:uncharacterized LabA/DUF88 family protein
VAPSDNASRKTGVYVDGYNLYYGRLRGSAFKWLDLVKLAEDVLAKRDQNENLEGVHLFTAHALASFATHGDASVEAQSAYHRALQAKHGKRFTVTYGKHSFDRDGSLLPEFVAGQPYDRTKRTRVWRLEEKKTDVNLALSMYRHAAKGLYDRIVLVSNDSDAEPALQAIREDYPHMMIGLIVPIMPAVPGNDPNRRVSGSLTNLADWVVKHLTDDQLQAAQLPPHVPTKKKPIRKPPHW